MRLSLWSAYGLRIEIFSVDPEAVGFEVQALRGEACLKNKSLRSSVIEHSLVACSRVGRVQRDESASRLKHAEKRGDEGESLRNAECHKRNRVVLAQGHEAVGDSIGLCIKVFVGPSLRTVLEGHR